MNYCSIQRNKNDNFGPSQDPHNLRENGKMHSVHHGRFICLSVEQSIAQKCEIIKLIIKKLFLPK